MSQVTLSVGGRKYTVACADGEETHIARLGESIDAKFRQIGNGTGPESQNLLFACLLLADELHDAKAAGGVSQNAGPSAADTEEAKPADADPELVQKLERFATLLENCADKLESKVGTS